MDGMVGGDGWGRIPVEPDFLSGELRDDGLDQGCDDLADLFGVLFGEVASALVSEAQTVHGQFHEDGVDGCLAGLSAGADTEASLDLHEAGAVQRPLLGRTEPHGLDALGPFWRKGSEDQRNISPTDGVGRIDGDLVLDDLHGGGIMLRVGAGRLAGSQELRLPRRGTDLRTRQPEPP